MVINPRSSLPLLVGALVLLGGPLGGPLGGLFGGPLGGLLAPWPLRAEALSGVEGSSLGPLTAQFEPRPPRRFQAAEAESPLSVQDAERKPAPHSPPGRLMAARSEPEPQSVQLTAARSEAEPQPPPVHLTAARSVQLMAARLQPQPQPVKLTPTGPELEPQPPPVQLTAARSVQLMAARLQPQPQPIQLTPTGPEPEPQWPLAFRAGEPEPEPRPLAFQYAEWEPEPHAPPIQLTTAEAGPEPQPPLQFRAEPGPLPLAFQFQNAEPEPRFSWPLSPVPQVTRPFQRPETDYGPGHRGVDLAAAPGQQVLAAGPGVVVFAGQVAGQGAVSIDHDGGLRTTYEPVTPIVAAGMQVYAGQPIGTAMPGHPGCPVAACLHWGVRRGDEYLNPLALIRTESVIRLKPWDPP